MKTTLQEIHSSSVSKILQNLSEIKEKIIFEPPKRQIVFRDDKLKGLAKKFIKRDLKHRERTP